MDSISERLYGRRKIFTSTEYIDESNIIQEVNDALSVHYQNAMQIDYLYWYKRGVQPILNRTKEVRPEINDKVIVNNANMVVTFKNGYFLSDPVSYRTRKDDEKITKAVSKLNEYLYNSGKHDVDNEVVNWFHTVGVGVVYVEPNKKPSENTPYKCYALDPRSAFVVYSLRPGNRPLFAVNIVVTNDGKSIFDVFTDNEYFRIIGGATGKIQNAPIIPTTAMQLESVEPNVLGCIPVIEYVYNEDRTASFEPAITVMDAINDAESNRADGIDLAVQQLCVAYNCNFAEGTTANTIRQAGMIVLKSTNENKADFKLLESHLSQSETQTTISSLYDHMLEICGVPSSNRNPGSTSDNVGAVYLRAGWASADTHARNTEELFKKSNRLFDEVMLAIVSKKTGTKLNLDDFELCFVRNDNTSLLFKTQAAIGLKNLGFAPEIAFSRSGVSSDPLTDIEKSKKYIEAVWDSWIEPKMPVEGQDVDNPNVGNQPQKTEQQKQMAKQSNWVEGYYRSGDK